MTTKEKELIAMVKAQQEIQKSTTFGSPKWEAASRKIHILAECIVSEQKANR